MGRSPRCDAAAGRRSASLPPSLPSSNGGGGDIPDGPASDRAGAVAVDMRVTAEEGHGCERGEITRIVHFFGRPHGRGGRERRGGAKIRRQRPMSRGISVYCVVSLEIARPLREETSRSASGVMTRGGREERRCR